MALDQPSVPIREKCGLGQITGYVVSNASDLASDQVDRAASTRVRFFGVVRGAGQGLPQGGQGSRHGCGRLPLHPPVRNQSTSSAPRRQGWKIVDFPEPPPRWKTGRPTSSSTSKRGPSPVARRQWQLHSLRPGHGDRRLQARLRCARDPVRQLPDAASRGRQPQPAPHLRRDQWWPIAQASQNPSTRSSSPPCTSTPRATPSTSTTRRGPRHGSCGRSRPQPAVPASR